MVTCEIEPGDWICIKDGWFQVRRVERDYSLSDSAGSGFYEELIYFRKNPDRYGVTRRKFVTGVLSDEAMLQNIKQILVSAKEDSAVGIIKRNAPTIQAVPIKKGHWIWKDFDEDTGISKSYWCSECNQPLTGLAMAYCGCCGAKMEGV